MMIQKYQTNKSSKKSLSQKLKNKPKKVEEVSTSLQLTGNVKQPQYTKQSIFNIYNQKMKVNLNNSDTKGMLIQKSKKQAVVAKSSIVKDFSTGNLNLGELIDREDEYLSYTDPRNQINKKPLSSKRPTGMKHSEKDDLIVIQDNNFNENRKERFNRLVLPQSPNNKLPMPQEIHETLTKKPPQVPSLGSKI
jgi:hypothetical protein